MKFFNILLIGSVLTGFKFSGAVLPKPANIAATAKGVRKYITSGIHAGCGSIKGCLPNSAECTEYKNCRLMVTYQPAPAPFHKDYYKIELLGRISRKYPTGYVALGISSDEWMGADLVLACVLNPAGVPDIETYWNTEKNPQTSKRYTGSRFECDTKTSHLAACEISVVTITEGRFIYCSFYLKKYVELHDKIFDMEHFPFYLLRARGYEVTAGGIAKHRETFVSLIEVELWNHGEDHEQRVFMISGHAVMLIGVYLVFLPNGFMVARYFKESVIHYAFMGRRPYQVFHIMIMLWTCFWTFVSMHNLHSYKGFLNMFKPSQPDKDTLAHAYVGSVSVWTIFMIVVFNIVCCWCGPRRQHPIFPITHFALGNIAYISGLYVLVTAHRMKAGTFPCENGFVALGSVLWTIIWNIVMTVHRRKLEVTMLQSKASIRSLLPLPLPEINDEEAPFLRARLWYLTFHFLGCLVFSGVILARSVDNTEHCFCESFMCFRTETQKLRFPSTEP